MRALSVLRKHMVAAFFMITSHWLSTGATDAKVPGAIHCFNDICHRVRTVAETTLRIGIVEPVTASYYDAPEKDPFNPRLETSSGAEFDPDATDNAASPIHPDGTILLVWSPLTGGAAIIRINNAGPYHSDRTLDVSRAVAENLGFTRAGTASLLTVVIQSPLVNEARYVRARVYPAERGYLGTFRNLALASLEDVRAHAAVFRGAGPVPTQAIEPTPYDTVMPVGAVLTAAVQGSRHDVTAVPQERVQRLVDQAHVTTSSPVTQLWLDREGEGRLPKALQRLAKLPTRARATTVAPRDDDREGAFTSSDAVKALSARILSETR